MDFFSTSFFIFFILSSLVLFSSSLYFFLFSCLFGKLLFKEEDDLFTRTFQHFGSVFCPRIVVFMVKFFFFFLLLEYFCSIQSESVWIQGDHKRSLVSPPCFLSALTCPRRACHRDESITFEEDINTR